MDDATFDDLTRSLEQAAAHARGKTVPGLRVHVPREVDVGAPEAESAPRGGDLGSEGVTGTLPRIASVAHIGPTALGVAWRDGPSDRVDLARWIATGGDILAPLKDEATFATARLGDFGAAVEWGPEDGDLAIDAHHLQMIADEQRR